nr:hypothetical protein [Tanacetum cinerariifolium]
MNVARDRENVEKCVPLQAEQSNWLVDTDEEINEQELEAHYSYMEKIQEVPTADSGTGSEPLEHVQYNDEYNVFTNVNQHCEQSESTSNTCLVENDNNDVTPDSLDIKAQSEKPCLYEIPNDQSDPTNRLVPDWEETLILAEESRSKLNKDFVQPYDYTRLNSLYEIFKPAPQGNHEQLAHTNEVRKKM